MRYLHITLLLLFAFAARAETIKNGFAVDDALVPTDEIRRGGPPRDGIPAIYDPVFVPADEAGFVRDKDRVLGIEISGQARAYPVNILNYHEIVNDEIDGRPIVVTFCPLCGSGMAFDASKQGVRLYFGVSGLLYNSDVLLYDRNTESLWSQIMRTAVTGQLKGEQLEPLPLAHTTWRDWLAKHPETEVLSMEANFRRNYRVSPYAGYAGSNKLYFPVAEENRKYRRKEKVLGLEIDGHFRAYPFEELERGPDEFSDRFRDQEITVRFDEENETAWIEDAEGDEIPTLISFWFAWYAFHPDTEIYTAD